VRALIASLLAVVAIVATAGNATAGERNHLSITTVGDSITAGGSAHPGHSYPDHLQRRLGGAATVSNAGVGGRCIVARGCGDGVRMVDTFADVLADEPDVVVLNGGRNDFCHVETRVLTNTLARLRWQGAKLGVRVVLSTATPANARWPWPCEEQRIEVNEWIRTQPDYVDLEAALIGKHTGELRRRFDSGDGLHPNSRGYARMAAAVYRHLH